MFKILKYLA